MEMQEKEEPVSVSITNGMASFEIMARVDGYKTSGRSFDAMVDMLEKAGIKERMDKNGMRVQGVWTLSPLEVWNEGLGHDAGTKMV